VNSDYGHVGRDIFVFGSNKPHGRHGKGAALFAVQNHGAIYGQDEGLQGFSYAIPTKRGGRTGPLTTLPLWEIEWHVVRFLLFAESHPNLLFKVTPIGTGLAGYTHDQIAPLFRGASDNCILPPEWRCILE
jgi:hypothetical protein